MADVLFPVLSFCEWQLLASSLSVEVDGMKKKPSLYGHSQTTVHSDSTFKEQSHEDQTRYEP